MKKTLIVLVLATSLIASPVFADEKTQISETKKKAIATNCESIKEKLNDLQHEDAKARVYLGRYYETIQSKFITPLNVRLVENTLSSDSFVTNQNKFNKQRSNYMVEFIESQKALDDLIATGGTLAAAKNLIEQGGAKVTDFFGVIGLPALNYEKVLSPCIG